MSSRERIYRAEGVVLRRHDFGETGRILTVFTPQYGKLRLLAKGVRRPGSRKAGHLEPFTRVDLMIARGRELDIITQAQALDIFPVLRKDLLQIGRAAYVVELIDRFTVAESDARQLYRLLVETLERLSGDTRHETILRYYEIRLLDLTGFRPELSRCLGCEDEILPQDQYFSSSAGGVLCPNCGRGNKSAQPISLSALKVLRHFQRSAFIEIASIQVGEDTNSELERIVEAYLSYVLERRLNAPMFLRQVRNLMRSTNNLH